MGLIGPDKTEPGFTVTINTSAGVKTWNFQRKPEAELEAMLHEHEGTTAVGRKGNPVVKWDTNYVASNEPCEDRSAGDIVPRGQADHPGHRDLVLLSVIDGHAGDATSQLLSKTLHPTIALYLAGLQAGIVPGRSWYNKITDVLTWAKTWSPLNVSRVLQTAYVHLDDNICQAPIKQLPSLLAAEDEVEARQKFVALAQPAAAGAVTATAFVDAENDGLYVAVAGDCRAVAGWQAADGSWRCDVLSEDQMGENPREVARMRSEHPSYEADTVIRNGRVQGGLQPTRAFGDAVYKWTSAQSQAVADVFRAEGAKPRSSRPWNFTPPYVTARPEVTHRTLHQGGEKLKFLVLATDGLWDRITSEEATLLMAAYIANAKRPDVGKATLADEIKVKTTEPRLYPVEDLPGKGKRTDGTWAFEGDENAATHLIRNALGGGDRKLRGELLSLHGKVSRYMRDDMTVKWVRGARLLLTPQRCLLRRRVEGRMTAGATHAPPRRHSSALATSVACISGREGRDDKRAS
ncbi:hypothetical protein VHUM_01575 [Vanrija humicola]|uniref:PPM-type phosphatase domain-containing protein n=1 Tax=Vanrija humicola TaxID=5417 RepID=A0A7D8Z5V6_VANHU|nr:hypothetical protein VHUM_01575 [Vanrija humicola]